MMMRTSFIVIAAAFLGGCGRSEPKISEEILFERGVCAVVAKAIVPTGGFKSDVEQRLTIRCRETDIDLFRTRYPKFYSVRLDPDAENLENPTVEIEYCQYRGFTSFEAAQRNLQKAKQEFADQLTFSVTMREVTDICDAYNEV